MSTFYSAGVASRRLAVLIMMAVFVSPNLFGKWIFWEPQIEKSRLEKVGPGDPPPDPCTWATAEIQWPQNLPTTPGTAIGWNGQKIIVNGTVTLTGNVTLNKCSVKMMPGASIIVSPNVKFAATFSIFASCNQMWGRIEIQNKASVNFSRCTFRHGTQAIQFEPNHDNAASQISGCYFERNWAGIQVNPTAIFDLPNFAGNTFYSDGAVLLPPLQTSLSYAGIILNTSYWANIGASGTNYFDQMAFGIDMINSIAQITGQSFSNMIDVGDPSGIGIFARTSMFAIRNCYFDSDQRGGILVNQPVWAGSISTCHFDHEGQYGVWIGNNATLLATAVDVTQCYFTMDQPTETAAIHYDRNPLTTFGSNGVRNNRVTVTSTKNAGYKIIDIPAANGGSDIFDVGVNYIDNFSPSDQMDGITLSGTNANNFIVDGNVIDYGSNVPLPSGPTIRSLGIVFNAVVGNGNTVINNIVTSRLFDNNSYLKCAIHVHNSPRLLYCRNRCDNTYRGYHFSGALAQCFFGRNTMNHHTHGIECVETNNNADSNPTNLGNQIRTGNKWLSSPFDYQLFGASYTDASTAPFAFKVDGSVIAGGGYSFLPPSVNIGAWFVPEAGPPDTTCNGGNTILLGLSNKDQQIAEGIFQSETESGSFDNRRDLIDKLLRKPELKNDNWAALSFFEGEKSGSAYQFAVAEKAFFDAFSLNSANQAMLLSNQANALLAELTTLDSIQSLTPEEIEPQIAAQQKAKTEELATLWVTMTDHQNDIRAEVESKLNVAKILIENLSEASEFERNRKQIFRLKIKKALNGELSENELSTVRAIAYKCPLDGGEIVAQAHFLLPVAEQSPFLNEDFYRVCANSYREAIERGSKTSISVPIATVVPNPNQGNFSVVFTKNEIFSGNWAITDGIGRTIKTGSLSEKTTQFDLSLDGKPNGIYFLTLIENGKALARQKIALLSN